MAIVVNSKQAIEHITTVMKSKLVTMLSGEPGIGKSAIINSIAEKFKLFPYDIRLSQCDPTDLQGFPSIKGNRAVFTPMELFPLEDTPLPYLDPEKPKLGTYNGFLLFLDEFNSASLAVQAASYKLILDKTVGQHKLHPKTAIVCAGNLSTNNAIVNRMSTAMQSRLVHLELCTDPELWIEWASKHKLDHRVISYIHSQPDNLHKFDPKHNDKTFACPRSWEFISRILANSTAKLKELLPLIAGTIGEGVARTFIAYTMTIGKLPTFEQIIRNPTGAILDEEPSLLYAVSHMVAAYAKQSNLVTLMKYVTRMPLEFETITLQNILRRDETLIKEEVIQDWIAVKGQEIF